MPITVVPKGARLAAAPGDLSPRAIRLERVVSLPPEALWPLWTSAAGLARWLVGSSRVELRIGGAYELYFLPDNPPGTRGGEGNRVLSFLAPRMLSFTWNAPPELEETRDAKTWVVVEFEAVAEGARVRLSHVGWPESGWVDEGGQWPQTFAYFETAWVRVLDALERYAQESNAQE
ncbi:MAG: SRPBCC domain-containing protein [Alphaproteobacteria bacterium]|nr:SRPBCC domain-containing protein [Alphaproteobacteria bacterium]